jgi:pilus assembly protein Flp/PilA
MGRSFMTAQGILARLVKDIRGSTAIEYGFILAIIVIASIAAFKGVADENTGLWAIVSNKTTDAIAEAN